MEPSAADLRLAAMVITLAGSHGYNIAVERAGEEAADVIHRAMCGNHLEIMLNTPLEERASKLLEYAKPNLPASLHPLIDEAIAITDDKASATIIHPASL